MRYFPHKLPVALDGERATFVFVQTDHPREVIEAALAHVV